jgi:hypothetical protein
MRLLYEPAKQAHNLVISMHHTNIIRDTVNVNNFSLNTSYDRAKNKIQGNSRFITSWCVILLAILWVDKQLRLRAACGVCDGQSGNEAGFLRVRQFPLPIIIPPIYASS